MPRVVQIQSQPTATAATQRDLSHERSRSRQLRASVADRSQAEEALKTLDLIDRLYQQEERLWTYYEALHSSAETRQSMLEQRLELERLLYEQEKIQKNINKQLQVLQPEPSDTITFNH